MGSRWRNRGNKNRRTPSISKPIPVGVPETLLPGRSNQLLSTGVSTPFGIIRLTNDLLRELFYSGLDRGQPIPCSIASGIEKCSPGNATVTVATEGEVKASIKEEPMREARLRCRDLYSLHGFE